MKKIALSSAQERIWLEWKLNPTSLAYNNPLLYQLQGKLNLPALTATFQKIINNQPALRVYFEESNGEVYQVLLSERSFELDFHDLRNHPDQQSYYIDRNIKQPFEFNRTPLYRFSVLQIQDETFILILNIHHIVVDGYSASLLLQDITRFYNGITQADNQSTVADEIYLENIQQSENNFQDAKNFWQQKLSEAQFAVDIYKEAHLTSNTDSGERHYFEVDVTLTSQLRSIAKKYKTTTFNLLFALFSVCLRRFAYQQDMIVAYPVNTRSKSLSTLYGMYVNSIPQRINFDGIEYFSQLIEYLNTERKAVKPYIDFDVFEILKIIRSQGENNLPGLFNVSFIPANFALQGLDLNGLHVTAKPVYTGHAKDDFALLYDETDQFVFALEYRTQYYSKALVHSFANYFVNCLHDVVARDNPNIESLGLNIKPEITHPLPSHSENFLKIIFNHALDHPDHIAIHTKNEEITYADFITSVHALIHKLTQHAMKPDQPIIVLLSRSPLLIISLLALQTMGITYIPVDYQIPIERLKFIIADCNASCVLVDEHKDWNIQTINITELPVTTKQYNLQQSAKPAYIIYTSGSTGNPKGVIISRDALNNFLYSMTHFLKLTSQDIWLAITTISFDISALEIYLPLMQGASIYLCDNQEHKDPFKIKPIFEKFPITYLQATPSFWQMLLNAQWQGHNHLNALCGGEALQNNLTQQLLPNVKTLWNVYGPTEATVWCAIQQIDSADKITVGKALPHIKMCILNNEGFCLPQYAQGELNILGTAIANGYQNRDDLNHAKFYQLAGYPAFRSGDLAVQTQHNEFVILNRIDNQVKVNGYRIEISEIESRLQTISDVKQAAVIIHKQQLIAFVVTNKTQLSSPSSRGLTAGSSAVEMDLIQNHLVDYLPEYMIPKQIIEIDSLPLTKSGKIDRKSLTQHISESAKNLQAPATQTEISLAHIWQETLSNEITDIHTHFYRYGGHSLLAVQVCAQIYKLFKKEIRIADVFQHPTIAKLAKYIDTISADVEPLNYTSEKNSINSTQARIWFLLKLEKDVGQYNLGGVLHIKKIFDENILQQTLYLLMQAHPSLTTVFNEIDGEIILSKTHSPTLPFANLDKELTEWINLPFKLTNSLLWRMALIKNTGREFSIAICLHHLIADGYSIPIFVNDFLRIYSDLLEGNVIEIPKNFHITSATGSEEKAIQFWKQHLSNISELNLPLDFARSKRQSYQGQVQTLKLNGNEWDAIKRFCKQQEISVVTYVFAAIAILMRKLSDQETFCLGMPVSTRTPRQQAIDCLMNLIPMQVHFSQTDNWLQQLQMQMQECIALQIPFNTLLTVLQVQRRLNQSPLFNVIVNTQPAIELATEFQACAELEFIPSTTSKYDLNFENSFSSDELTINCEYAISLFKAETISSMLNDLRGILFDILNHNVAHVSTVNSYNKNTIKQPELTLAPLTPFQQTVARVWQEALNISSVTSVDNYFSLGGDSILMTKIIVMMEKQLKIRCQLETFFLYPNFIDFCAQLEVIETEIDRHTLLPQALTPNQKQVIVEYEKNRNSAYHLGIYIRVKDFSVARLKQAIKTVLQQHHTYYQYLSKDLALSYAKQIDVNLIEVSVPDIQVYAEEFAHILFDLHSAPLIRFALAHSNNGDYLIIICHHLIADEWTLKLMVEAIWDHYYFPVAVKIDSVMTLSYPQMSSDPYKTYIQDYKALRLLPTLNLSQPQSLGFHNHILNSQLTRRIKHQAKLNHTTPSLMLLFAFSKVLEKFSYAKGYFGVAFERRNTANALQQHGYLVNILPFVSATHFDDIQKHWQFLLKHTEIDCATLLAHNIIQPLQIIFNYQHANAALNHRLEWWEIKNKFIKFPFVFNIRECDEYFEISIEYAAHAFSKEYIGLFIEAFIREIEPQVSIQNSIDISLQENILSCLQNIASTYPENIAIEYQNSKLTYDHIWQASKGLANRLMQQHPDISNTCIGISLPNGPDYVIACLAVLMLNAYFVPIDTQYPEARKLSILNSGISLLLTVSSCPVIGFQKTFILEDIKISNTDLAFTVCDDSGYIIFTSGTTGNPKGCINTQINLMHFIKNISATLNINSQDRILQFSSIGFDASIWEIFTALCNGATLCIPNANEKIPGKPLEHFIQNKNISHCILVPSVLATLNPSHLPALKTVASGGEICQASLVDRWCELVAFYNAYGPAECAVCTSLHLFKRDDKPTLIGKALVGNIFLIVNSQLEILSKGAIGELLISGASVGKGYLNFSEEKNNEKFILLNGQRWYRTGDLARYVNEDNIEYIGRIDTQVKLRGVRIELQEIVFAIQTLGVQQAVCKIYEDTIHAYVVHSSVVDSQLILNALDTLLPKNYLPATITQLDDFPLTINGKINLEALPMPTFKSEIIQVATTANEIVIANIWKKYLTMESLNVTSSFFSLGGNSLQLMQIAAELSEHFQKQFHINDFYANATIEKQGVWFK